MYLKLDLHLNTFLNQGASFLVSLCHCVQWTWRIYGPCWGAFTVIAGVGDSRSGLSSQLWLAVSFHKTSPMLLYFCWIFDVIKDKFYNYDLLSVLLSFAVFFKKSFIMQVMFKKSNCGVELENSFLLYSVWNNYCCLLRLSDCCGAQSSHCPVLAEKEKKKSCIKFFAIKNLEKLV